MPQPPKLQGEEREESGPRKISPENEPWRTRERETAGARRFRKLSSQTILGSVRPAQGKQLPLAQKAKSHKE